MPFPFEVSFAEIRADPDAYVDSVFGALHSEFMLMPRGKGFVEFNTFEAGYETLKRATAGSGPSLRRPFAAHRDSVSELVGTWLRAPSKTC